MSFETLASFIESHMRMAHVDQPVTLLRDGGTCSEEQIARALLSYDISQVEYYENITRNVVGRVLKRHGIVSRDHKSKSYTLHGRALTPSEREQLIDQCQA